MVAGSFPTDTAKHFNFTEKFCHFWQGSRNSESAKRERERQIIISQKKARVSRGISRYILLVAKSEPETCLKTQRFNAETNFRKASL